MRTIFDLSVLYRAAANVAAVMGECRPDFTVEEARP